MDAILQTEFFMCIFYNGDCFILIHISLRYVLKGPIDNNNRRQAISATNYDSLVTHIG